MSVHNINASVELRPNGHLVVVFEVPALVQALEHYDMIDDPATVALSLLNSAARATEVQHPVQFRRNPNIEYAIDAMRGYLKSYSRPCGGP